MTMQFRIYCTKSSTRWFKVTLSSPSWRSLNLSKRSLNHPKKGTAWITRYMLCHTAQSIWVFPKIGVPPISHPKMIIFSRKTHGFVGETHHFRNPPYVVQLAPEFWGRFFHVLHVLAKLEANAAMTLRSFSSLTTWFLENFGTILGGIISFFLSLGRDETKKSVGFR